MAMQRPGKPRHHMAMMVAVVAVWAGGCSTAKSATPTESAATEKPVSDGDEGNDAGQIGPTTSTTAREKPVQVPDAATPFTVPQAPISSGTGFPSVFDGRFNKAFPPPLIDPDHLREGGPNPDGIPAIDQPEFLKPADVRYLKDNEPVIAFGLGDDQRAYPVQVLIWHEVVNDTVAGVPVTISYCPLCNTAQAFDRRVGAKTLIFGVSGLLYQSDLVLFDRQTNTLWSQLLGRAIVGNQAGASLNTYPTATLSWGEWRRAHPEGLVLARPKQGRDYGRNPYPGYDRVDLPPYLFVGEVDGRLAPKERVVGVKGATTAVAVTFDRLRRERLVSIDVDGRPGVVLWRAGAASALDAGLVAAGADVGMTGVFRGELDAAPLDLVVVGDGWIDKASGSTLDVTGRFTAGPLAGRLLERLRHVDTFWFAWPAFEPTTQLLK